MMRNSHVVKSLLLLLAAVSLAIFISVYIFPVYFYGDDADLLLGGKYFSGNAISIFSLSAPTGEISQASRMLMWYYYRPLDRILWAVSFALFGFNPIPLHAVEIFLFIFTLYNLFKVTNYMSGSKNKLPGFLCVFSLLVFFYPFDKALLTFLAHGNTFLMLFFMSLSFVYFFEAYNNASEKKMRWAMFFTLLAFLSKEWSLYAIPAIFFIYFYFKWEKSSIAEKRIAFKTSVFFFVSLIAVLILQLLFRNNIYAEKASNLLNIDYFFLNLKYFVSLIASVLPMFALGLLSLCVFRNKGQMTILLWSVITLIPALFYKNLCVQSSLHYLFLTVIGLSIFIGIGIYLAINELYLLLVGRTKITWYENKYLSNLWLLCRQVFLLPVVLCFAAAVSFNNYKCFRDDIMKNAKSFHLQKESFGRAVSSEHNSSFFVTDELKQKTYTELLYTAGRKDVQIKVLNEGSIEASKTGENIIKNGSFESDLENWGINFKRAFTVSNKVSLNGAKSLEIDLEGLSKVSGDFVEVTQDIKVKPGQPYLFGASLNISSDFSGHFWIEIRDKRGWRYGYYIAPLSKEPNIKDPRWVIIQNYFIPTAEEFQIVCRGFAPIKGKIHIDEIFLYPAKISILD